MLVKLELVAWCLLLVAWSLLLGQDFFYLGATQSGSKVPFSLDPRSLFTILVASTRSLIGIRAQVGQFLPRRLSLLKQDLTPDPLARMHPRWSAVGRKSNGSGLKGGGPVWAIPLQIDYWRNVLISDTSTHTISHAFAMTGRSAFSPVHWPPHFIWDGSSKGMTLPTSELKGLGNQWSMPFLFAYS